MASLDRSGQPGEGAGGAHLLPHKQMLNKSELFRDECRGLIDSSSRACQRLLEEDRNALRQRVKHVEFVRREMETMMEAMTSEMEVLGGLGVRVGHAVHAAEDRLEVTLFCLEERGKASSEPLRDDVDSELGKERHVVEGVISVLQRVDVQITEQIRLNRSVKFHLEQDLKDKLEAQNIDQSCSVIRTPSSSSLQSPVKDTPSVSPQQWDNMSELLITKAALHQTNSQSLGALVESLLEQTAADVQQQLHATTAAFQLNVSDMKALKGQMEEQIPKIQSEISDHQRIREDLLTAVTDNENTLRLANARLAMRSQRPGKEKCHDPVQSQLLSELHQLNQHISKLRKAMVQSEEQQRELSRRHRNLQDAIRDQDHLIYLDQVTCLTQRLTGNTH